MKFGVLSGLLCALLAPSAWAAGTVRHFSVDAGSVVAYQVHVKTLGFLNETVEGVNPAVRGEITLTGNGPTGWIEAPISAFRSGIKGRDKNVAEILGMAEFPMVRFDLDRLAGFEPTVANGQATAIGQLSAHGRSHPLKVPVTYQLANGRLAVQGTAPLRFSDYGISAPILGFVVKRAPDDFFMHLAILATEDKNPALSRESP